MEGSQGRDAYTITFRYRAEKSKIFGVIKRPVAKVYLRTWTSESITGSNRKVHISVFAHKHL